MKLELLKIIQNVIRLGLTGAPILYIIWVLDRAYIGDQPLWLAIMLGSILGGCVFIPAKEIGDSIWAIVVLHVESALGKPTTDDEADQQQIGKYNQWASEMREATLAQTIRRVFIPAAKIAAKIVSPVAIITLAAIIYLGVSRSDPVNTIVLTSISLGIAWGIILLVFTVFVVILLSLLFKLYYNDLSE